MAGLQVEFIADLKEVKYQNEDLKKKLSMFNLCKQVLDIHEL